MRVNLETERLIIRDPNEDDFESIWKMRNDPHVTRFTGGVTLFSKEELRERHLKRTQDIGNSPREYSVVLKESNEYIGYCGFQYCSILDGIEILYGYDKKFWGKGYALEAARAVLEFGIKKLDLKEVVAAVNYDNIASDKVLGKIGMKFSGEIEWPGQGMVKKYIYRG